MAHIVKIKKFFHEQRTTKTCQSYKVARKHVNELITIEKQQEWNELGDQIEHDCKGNRKLFYKTLKTVRENET